MHTAKQMIPAVGQHILVQVEGWQVPMVVTDAKSAWGNVRLQVHPIHGMGAAWIQLERVIRVIDSSNVTSENAGRQIAMNAEVK